MKTINQMALVMGTGIFLAALSFGTANAQTKPKGKEWKVSEADAKKKSAIKSDDAAIKTGKDIWTQHCKSCHGVKGEGDGAKAAKLEITCGDFSSSETQNLSDGALYWKVTEGRKPMPSFKEKLNDTERWQVIAYMRTLKKK
jgi:mono/diheme cytochrome c family protein